METCLLLDHCRWKSTCRWYETGNRKTDNIARLRGRSLKNADAINKRDERIGKFRPNWRFAGFLLKSKLEKKSIEKFSILVKKNRIVFERSTFGYNWRRYFEKTVLFLRRDHHRVTRKSVISFHARQRDNPLGLVLYLCGEKGRVIGTIRKVHRTPRTLSDSCTCR